MKKHTVELAKLDRSALEIQKTSLLQEITETRQGVLSGEITNNQLIRQKRRQLARVKTILNTSSVVSTDVETKSSKKETK